MYGMRISWDIQMKKTSFDHDHYMLQACTVVQTVFYIFQTFLPTPA